MDALPPRERALQLRALTGCVAAIMGELSATAPGTADPLERRRAAIVSVGAEPLDALDGRAIADALERAGWAATELAADAPPEDVAALAHRERSELAVLPTARPADVLRLAPAYTLLRRLPDPPVIVACTLGAAEDLRRARGVGADDHATCLGELLAAIAQHLPDAARRRWGVGIQRVGERLVLRPTGDLDAQSVGRLDQVASSRAGTFDRLVVGLGDVAGFSPEGASALAAWCTDGGRPRELRPRLEADGALLDALLAEGLERTSFVGAGDRAALRWGA
ncbi:MAG TPA: response regulator [Baekduia sp.]|nr:response regulator [Baekduia sp.]